jgi:hypothetical protein
MNNDAKLRARRRRFEPRESERLQVKERIALPTGQLHEAVAPVGRNHFTIASTVGPSIDAASRIADPPYSRAKSIGEFCSSHGPGSSGTVPSG